MAVCGAAGRLSSTGSAMEEASTRSSRARARAAFPEESLARGLQVVRRADDAGQEAAAAVAEEPCHGARRGWWPLEDVPPRRSSPSPTAARNATTRGQRLCGVWRRVETREEEKGIGDGEKKRDLSARRFAAWAKRDGRRSARVRVRACGPGGFAGP